MKSFNGDILLMGFAVTTSSLKSHTHIVYIHPHIHQDLLNFH